MILCKTLRPDQVRYAE